MLTRLPRIGAELLLRRLGKAGDASALKVLAPIKPVDLDSTVHDDVVFPVKEKCNEFLRTVLLLFSLAA